MLIGHNMTYLVTHFLRLFCRFIWLYKWVLIAFGLSILARIAFYFIYPYYIPTADSESYYIHAMVSTRFPLHIENFVSVFRTPVYPFFLGLILRGAGVVDENFVSSSTFLGAVQWMILLQSLLGVLSLLVIYKTSRLMHLSRFTSSLLVLLIGLNSSLILWEHAMMSEALAIFWICVMGYLCIRYVAYFYMRDLVLLGLWFSVGYLLRPAFLFLPFVMLSSLLFVQRKFKYMIVTLFMLVYCGLVPYGYAQLNNHYKHFEGFSWTTGIGMLAKVLQYKLPTDAGKKYTYIYDSVEYFKTQSTSVEPFRYLEFFGYMDAPRWKELEEYGIAILLANLPAYIYYSLLDIPKIFLEHPNLLHDTVYGNGILYELFYTNYTFYSGIKAMLIGMMPIFILQTIRWMFKKSSEDTKILIFGLSGMVQVLTVVFYSASYDYGMLERFSHIIQIHMTLYMYFVCYKMIKYLKHKIIHFHSVV